MANTMMQKFWDSALALEPPDDYDTNRFDFGCLDIIWLSGWFCY